MNKKTSSKQAPPASKDLNAEVLLQSLFQKEVERLATQLKIGQHELKAWLNLGPQAPIQAKIALLRIAIEYSLDPLKEEVLINQYDDGVWQAHISVDGWHKIMNTHPNFCGVTFNQSNEEIEDVPIWLECTIYRSDRGAPITIREYFKEVKSEQAIWNRMPRRMLRHRTLQQCAKLAFGISATFIESLNLSGTDSQKPCNLDRHINAENVSRNSQNTHSATSTLKEILQNNTPSLTSKKLVML
jgi:hypothetical protein